MISKRCLIAVFATCLYAIGMAVFALFLGVDREYLWLSALSIVATLAMIGYAKDIFDNQNGQETDAVEN